MQRTILVYKSVMQKPASRDQLFAHFERLGLAHTTVSHRPVFTVEESADIKSEMPGGHTKNLFLRAKDGALFLVCALGSTVVRLNQLHKTLGSARLSFGPPDIMLQTLGVTAGSVTLFALINDRPATVTLILDEALLAADPVNFHPLLNDATTAMSQGNMRKFIADWGGQVFGCDFSGELPLARQLMLAV